YYGAGIHITGGSAHIINTTFTNNEGSGIRLEGSSNVKLYNSVFFDNSSLDISTTSSESSVIGKNTFIEESYGIDDSGFNLLSSTPFLNSGNPKGDDGVLGTSDDGLYPATESLLVNAGANELNPEGTDIAGNSRIYQTIDIGAYEMQTPVLKPDVNNTIYVDKNIEGGNEDGSNWDNAVPELAMALEWAKRNETSWSESN
ncbi:right-handed parallel beta-helix repeat-containing protein, partial [Leeuwenhoekiella sp. CH_XMU1409-2]